MATCVSELTYSSQSVDQGDVVTEGTGNWMHWADYDKVRLARLQQQAVSNLRVISRDFDLICDSDDDVGSAQRRIEVESKRASIVLKHGWGAYNEYNKDFEGGADDPVYMYILKHDLRRRALDIVLPHIEVILSRCLEVLSSTFRNNSLRRLKSDIVPALHHIMQVDARTHIVAMLSALSSARVRMTARFFRKQLQCESGTYFSLLASEIPFGRIQLYPVLVDRVQIFFDGRLSFSKLYEMLFELQCHTELRKLRVFFGRALSSGQVYDFTELLEGAGFTREHLNLMIHLPSQCRRSVVLLLGNQILSAMNVRLVLVWRKAFLNHRYVALWARNT